MKASKHTCITSLFGHSGDVYSVKFHPGDVSIFKKKNIIHIFFFTMIIYKSKILLMFVKRIILYQEVMIRL